MRRITRLQPVYAAQLLAGVAGIGGVLLSGPITKFHILVSLILAGSVATSLLVSARAEADTQRTQAHLDTLLRSMELPYFIIQAVSATIVSLAKSRDWAFVRQENFQQETVYEFEAHGGQRGRLVVSAQEFKDLWILDDRARAAAIERRLFEPDLKMSASELEEYAGAAVREAIAEVVAGPFWVKLVPQPDGARIWEVRRTPEGAPLAVVTFSAARLHDLLDMVPLRRYHELAGDVRRALVAAPGNLAG